MDFKVGEGSSFALKTEGKTVDLNIYVAAREKKSLSVEMHFGAGGIFPFNMWQQFQFDFKENRPISISKGYILAKENKTAEIMPKELFKQDQGIQVQDFLFSKQSEFSKFFVGDELVETPAGTFVAKHFKRSRKGQIVDFWISEEVGPIGLVKLISTSESKSSQNYSVELKSLLKRVRPTINPEDATEISKESRAIFITNN